jgi:hypothetical protein
MANQFTIYKSTDASAPVLNETSVGSFIALLDACLVNGYGSKAAAGWSKAFSGTNIAAYRAPSGIRNYLQVTNTGASPSAIAYETMSDVNTGTHAYAGALSIYNSSLTTAPWVVAADAVTFYTFIQIASGSAYLGFTFGEFFSLLSSDSYRGCIRGPVNTGSLNTDDKLDTVSTSINSVSSAFFIDRGYTGVGGGINAVITGDNSKSGGALLNGSVLPYPNPVDGGLYLSPLWISDPSTSPINHIRGRIRGLWQVLQPTAAMANGDTFSGTGDLAGKTFLIIKPSGNAAVYTIETSATLETN